MNEHRDIDTGGGRYTENKGTYVENMTVINHGNQQSNYGENNSINIDRLSLMQILSSIPQEQLLQVIFTLKPPSGIIPSNSAAQGQQVFALLQWAESPYGCGLEQLQTVLNTIIKPPNHSKAVVEPITEPPNNHSKSSQTQVQSQSTMPNSLKYILHLSDLHFSKTWHLPLTLEDQAEIWSSNISVFTDLHNY